MLNPQRLLLAKLRCNDFIHAGDEHAIDLVLRDIHKIITPGLDMQALDVGCGLGGTAYAMQQKGLGQVSGIDIDDAAIEQYAKIHYPDVSFFACDVMNAEDIFGKQHFDIIYMFNAFYAFLDQQASLYALASIAKPGAVLAIFDYSLIDTQQPFVLQDLAGKPMHPVIMAQLYGWLANAGWELVEEKNLSQQYMEWYQELIIKLEKNRYTLIQEFSQPVYDKVYFAFANLLMQLKQKILGGMVVYARLGR